MRLLESLGLRVSKNVANAIAAKAAASAANGPPADRHAAAKAQMPADRHAAASKAQGTRADDESDAARKAALALRGKIEHHLKTTREELTKLTKLEPKVAEVVAAATGPKKAELEAKKKILDKKMADMQKEIDELGKDAEALDSPATGNDEYVAILARHKAATNVARTTEIDLHEQDLSKKRGEKHETTTTTSYADGAAVVDKTEKTRTWGLDGVTSTNKRETEVTFEKGSVKTEDEKKTTVSTTGKFTQEHKKSIEVEHADGKKTKLEKSSELEVGKEGVSGSKTTTISNRDGSSTVDKKEGGLERGEGKLGAAYGKTKTTTDSGGNETTKGAKGKGGLVASEEGGMGAYGEGKGTIGSARPGGFNTKAGLGLTSNITCDIAEPEGDSPLYTLTLKVRLGASVDAELGHAKKGGSVKVGVGVKASKEVTMEAVEHLTEAQLASYVKALQAASKGGKIASTKRELQVIQAGASRTWEIAKQMYESGGGPEVGDKEGDSVMVGGSSKKGASASLAIKAVSLEGSYEESESHSTKATRNKKGGQDIESSTEKANERSGKAGLDLGTAGMSNKLVHTEKTSLGYTITIDAGKDPGGKLLASFRACTTPQAQEQWIAANKDKVTVTGKKTGSVVGDKQDVGMKVLGADLSLNYENSVEKNAKTDAQGKLVESDVTGKAKVGGSLGVGDFRVGDSVADEAKSRRDGKGNAELDLTRTKSSTSLKKLFKKIPLIGGGDKDEEEEKKGKSGLLTDAAGGGKEADTDDRNIAGIHVTKADLARVVAIARSDPRRWTACVLRMDDYHPWEQVMRDVASAGDPGAAGDLLAEFAGKSPSTSRRDILEKLIRPTGDLTMATRSEFPESLRKLAKPYKELVMEECEARIDEVAKTKGKEEAGKLGKEMFDQLESMLRAVLNAEDFAKPAVQAEMSSAIQHRKTALQAAMRRNAGGGSKDDDAKAMRQEFGRLRMECGVYQQKQNELIGKFDKLLRGRQFISVNADGEEGRGYIEELGNLFALWRRDYAEATKIAKANGYTDVLPTPKDDELKRLKRAALMSTR